MRKLSDLRQHTLNVNTGMCDGDWSENIQVYEKEDVDKFLLDLKKKLLERLHNNVGALSSGGLTAVSACHQQIRDVFIQYVESTNEQAEETQETTSA